MVLSFLLPLRRFTRAFAIAAVFLLLASCASASAESMAVVAVSEAAEDVAYQDVALFDSTVVHDIEISFDQSAYDEMIDTFSSTGEKDWIEATVIVDGNSFTASGIRLKGNSSLFGLTSDTSGNPEDLPWLIRLDKYVDGQTYQGYSDIVIRSNSTETSLNEAVAQELLDVAGLASQQPISTTFTVNGSDTELRLALEHPDDEWDDANFDSDDGALYKADSEGDYSYRGDDPDNYDDVFNQKAGEDDLEPLIEFLDFINNSDDETFNAELTDRLDVDGFATYLAFQDLIGNADDINGRGNNSYLHYDYDTEQFTVVNWDLNLAFGTANVGGQAPGGDRGVQARAVRPERPAGPETDLAGQPGAARGGPGDQSNVLVDRFMADDEFNVMYNTKTIELTETLYTSGTIDVVVSNWTDMLISGTSVVDEATILSDAAAITAFAATMS